MGYIKHNAIIVTDWDEDRIASLHKTAKSMFGVLVSELVPSVANMYLTFLIAPDGSKEGWNTSNEYDKKREQFFRLMTGYPDAVEVSYDECGHAAIVRSME